MFNKMYSKTETDKLICPQSAITNYLGNIKLQLALVGVAIVFIPIGLIVYKQLRRLEKN